MPDTLVRVELQPGGSSGAVAHCGWCDLPLTPGWPRIVRHMPFHSAGPYSRNNGEKVGVNKGGPQNEHMHPACALETKESKNGATCSFCSARVAPGWHFVTRLGSPHARCTPSSSGHRWLHAECVRGLIERHRALLAGHLGQRQQFEEHVSWAVKSTSAGLVDPKTQRGIGSFFKPAAGAARRPRSNRALPACDATLSSLRAALSGFSDADEEKAVERHRALQARITQALKEDAELAKRKRADAESCEHGAQGGDSAADAAAAPKRQKPDSLRR